MFLLVIQYLRQTYSSQKVEPFLTPVFEHYLNFLLEIIKLGIFLSDFILLFLLVFTNTFLKIIYII